MTPRATLLFVHGAWHGSWCWGPLRQILDARGWVTAAVDLPSVHGPDKAKLGLAADAAAVRAAATEAAGDVVVVAHSYGGLAATQGADSSNVTGIVYVAAVVPLPGESALSILTAGGEPLPGWWTVRDGIATVGTSAHPPRELFYNDLDADAAAAAEAQLVPMSMRPFEDEVTSVSWPGRVVTYVLTEKDRCFPPAAQAAFAARAGADPVRLATGHSPFLSQPAALAGIIERAAAAQPSAVS